MVQFKTSPSYPALQVSDEGDVIGPSGRQLKHFPDKRGYRRVNLYLGQRRWTQLGVHFLVCETFHGPRPERHHVAHGDGNPANNHASNLRWATYRENESDKVNHGTRAWRERHGMHKLTTPEVLEIREIHKERYFGYRETAERFGVSIQQICSIVKRRSWKSLP
jgi:hypothetical protein